MATRSTRGRTLGACSLGRGTRRRPLQRARGKPLGRLRRTRRVSKPRRPRRTSCRRHSRLRRRLRGRPGRGGRDRLRWHTRCSVVGCLGGRRERPSCPDRRHGRTGQHTQGGTRGRARSPRGWSPGGGPDRWCGTRARMTRTPAAAPQAPGRHTPHTSCTPRTSTTLPAREGGAQAAEETRRTGGTPPRTRRTGGATRGGKEAPRTSCMYAASLLL